VPETGAEAAVSRSQGAGSQARAQKNQSTLSPLLLYYGKRRKANSICSRNGRRTRSRIARRGWRRLKGSSASMAGAGTDRTRPSRRGGPVIILVRPQLAVNVGMSARAMANFGLSELRLVSPRIRGKGPQAWWKDAEAAAAGAAAVLTSASVHQNVEDAVLDLNFLWATTARQRGQHKPAVAPAEAMPQSAAKIALGERHGVLFGPERTGLANDEIALADAIMSFPVNPAYGSLNLAQAVLLVGYEWMRAASDARPPFSMLPRSPPAPRKAILSFFGYLEAELERAGFFRPASKLPVMRRNLRNIFHRMQLTEQDLRTLRGMVVRLVNGPRAAGRAPAQAGGELPPGADRPVPADSA